MLKNYRGCRENAKCSNKSRLGAEKTPDAWKNRFGYPKIPQPNCKYRVPKNKRGCDLQFKLLSWRSFRLHVRKWKFLGVDIFGVGNKMRWTKKNEIVGIWGAFSWYAKLKMSCSDFASMVWYLGPWLDNTGTLKKTLVFRFARYSSQQCWLVSFWS